MEERLQVAIGNCKLGRPVYAYDVVSSTMDVAHQLAAEGAPEGTLVWATRQEQGRGRLGRTWISPEGGLYCSFILHPTRPVNETPELSLIAGQAAAEAIKEVTGLSPTVKWPNDLLLNGKKVAGILVETTTSVQHSADSVRDILNAKRSTLHAILGVGMNVTTRPEQLLETGTSLMAHGAVNADAFQLMGALCRLLSSALRSW